MDQNFDLNLHKDFYLEICKRKIPGEKYKIYSVNLHKYFYPGTCREKFEEKSKKYFIDKAGICLSKNPEEK